MKLLVIECKESGVGQSIVATRNVNVVAIRPHLYIHNQPSGKVRLEIHDSNGDLVSSSEELSFDAITAELFFHGYVRFYINAYLKKDSNYQVVVKGVDAYSFSEESYFGVCNAFDFQTYPASYSPNLGVNAPLDIQIWELK